MMEQKNRVVLDSCVVIDLIEKRGFANKLRAALRGKPVCIVLCNIVLNEVKRVRGFAAAAVASKIAKLVGKKVIVESVDERERDIARSVTEQYQFCHRGDNFVFALCNARDYTLLTFDRMLLQTCQICGVMSFHPHRAGGI